MTSNQPIQLGITGWGVISPIGIGVESFQQACLMGTSGRKPIRGYPEGSLPFDEACLIPEFETAAFLGPKGTRSLDRTTAFSVTASGMALKHSSLIVSPQNQMRIGVVLGTSTGSIKSISDFTRETLIQERPYLVNPMLFPNTVMNCAAGQTAIWHKLPGVNATVSGGRLSGLLALRHAGLMIRLGYADTIVCGAVEEFCEQMAWGFYHAGVVKSGGSVTLGEGCAMFMLENRRLAEIEGRKVLAEVLACEAGFYGQTNGQRLKQQVEGLAACIRRAIDQAGIKPNSIWAISSRATGDPLLDCIEEEGQLLALENRQGVKRIASGQLVGECFSASYAFQLAGLLTLFGSTSNERGRIGLVTTVGRSGGVGCAVIQES